MEQTKGKTQNIIDKIEKNYMTLNILGLGMVIYIIFFPVISTLLTAVVPEFGICPYLQMTGKPCPLCGGTRYFANIFKVFEDVTYLYSPFGIMAIIIFLELIFRIKNIIDLKRKKDCRTNIKIDIITTSIVVIAFFLYEILYFIFQK